MSERLEMAMIEKVKGEDILKNGREKRRRREIERGRDMRVEELKLLRDRSKKYKNIARNLISTLNLHSIINAVLV